MADEKPKTVKVQALQAHTAFGESYEPGETYDCPADFVVSVEAQGKAARVDATVTTPAKSTAVKGKRKTRR